MNCLYFACPNCRLYTDAGYRWAAWELKVPGLVALGEGVDVGVVLGCESYWNPPMDESHDWLRVSIFPTVRKFLEDHRLHGVVFVRRTLSI